MLGLSIISGVVTQQSIGLTIIKLLYVNCNYVEILRSYFISNVSFSTAHDDEKVRKVSVVIFIWYSEIDIKNEIRNS